MKRQFCILLILNLVIISQFAFAQVTLPWNEGFENAGTVTTFYKDTKPINGLPQWSYDEVNFYGRLRFNAGSGYYHTGSKAATMDRLELNYYAVNTNYLTAELDLSKYSLSSDLQLSFYHMHHDAIWFIHSNQDKAYIRGSRADKWIEIYDFLSHEGDAGVWNQVTGIDIDNLLAQANPPQRVSSTFQLRFKQYGSNYTTSTEYYQGRTIDDIQITGTLCGHPPVFEAKVESSTQIDLTWTHNQGNNNVLIAFNSSNTFGTPANGTVYSPGNTIPGGGTVLYYGSLLNFSHAGLNPNAAYFYKAWSYTGSTYTCGITSNATTPCLPVVSFPFAEGFENGGNIPSCWRQEYISGIKPNWIFRNGSMGGAHPANAHSGSYNACLQDTEDDAGITLLISPPLDLTGLSPVLTFWFTQEVWMSDQDELSIYYKDSAKGAWTILQTWITSHQTWTQAGITLPNTSNTSYIAFGGNAKYGRGICIDDVEISGRVLSTWTGNTSADWSVASNWNNSLIPDAGTDVIIPTSPSGGNFPEINSLPVANCFDLTIQSGAHLYVPVNKALTVNGFVTNNAGETGLIIKSNVSGTGSLIHSTPDIDATVERFLTKMKWHLIGMPIESGLAGIFDLPPGQSDIYLKTHIESTNTWGSFIVPVNYPLTQGRGYECWVGDPYGYQNDETIVFAGKLNAGDYTTGTGSFYDLEFTPGHGLNLICNPYPSAIEANLRSWNRNKVTGSVWTWDPGIGNYRVWNSRDELSNGGLGTLSGGIVPSMQAFFVLATGTNPSITIPQNSRVHNNQPYYKDSELPVNTLLLEVNGNGYQDAVIVNFDELATDAFDLDYDVEKIFGIEEAPQIYSKIIGKNLTINSLPYITDYKVVDVSFDCSMTSLYTLEASGMNGFEGSSEVYLEDLKENVLVDLNEQSNYSFSYNSEENPDRFLLHFGKPFGINDAETSQISIYSNKDMVYIQTKSNELTKVSICDILGKEITQYESSNENPIRIRVTSGTGYYLIKVQTGKRLFTEKVFIN